MRNRIIERSFFRQDPLSCARELVGTTLQWERCAGVVVETEAYLTENDEACHTFTRPSTRRFVERNKPGAAYIYFNYGAHWMLNVLVKGGPRTGLILIRALEPKRGLRTMKTRRGVDDLRRLCSGPGKLTQALAITRHHHERDLCAEPRHCFMPRENADLEVVASPRIGISRSVDFRWRFSLRDSPFISARIKPGS